MIVAKGPVDLVADQEDVAPAAELGQGTHFIGRADDAGRIGRGIDHHAFGPRGHGRLDSAGVDAEVGIGVDQHRHAPGQRGQVAIHHEIRVKDDHFVSRIDHAAKRQQKGTRGTRGDQNLAVGVTKLGIDGPLNLGPQLGNSLSDGIGVVASLDGLDGRGLDRARERRSQGARSRD